MVLAFVQWGFEFVHGSASEIETRHQKSKREFDAVQEIWML